MRGTCNECGDTVTFDSAGPAWTHSEGSLGQIVFHRGICPNCRSALLRIADAAGKVIHEWPTLGDGPAPAGVPAPIADDWREAHKDLGVRSWKSAATMARRAVQGACIDKGAAKGKPFAQQIKELAANSTLHQNIVDWADQIRLFGNHGAHPSDDGLEGVTNEDAHAAVAFLDQLLEWVYVMPGKLAEAKARAEHQ